MLADARPLIDALHTAAPRCALVVTGGGAEAVAALLAVPGASRTVLEAVVPYAFEALTEYLGFGPTQAVALETSRLMADRAFTRAEHFAPDATVFGVGCTATLVTDRPKKGDHRFHLTVRGDLARTSYSLVLAKGQRDRLGEEAVLSRVVLNALAEAFGIDQRLALPLLADEHLARESQPIVSVLTTLGQPGTERMVQTTDGRLLPSMDRPPLLLCGSFHPLHEGHLRLARAASVRLRQPFAFEISTVNVDKPPLTRSHIRQRLAQFVGIAPVWVTQAATYAEKAPLFPGTTFVVGADTAERIVQPRYYGSDADMLARLERIRQHGCRFLVAGRVTAEGRFVGRDQIAIPAAVSDLFEGLSETEFRLDVSSTQLRGPTAMR